MLADLCIHFSEAREAFDRIDRLYAEHPRGHVLSDWVFPRPAFSDAERRATEERLMELDIAVESVLTANAAMYALVRRLVPHVDAMLGHSTGEHSAAMAAGALDLETEERLAMFCHGLHASYADAAARHEVPGAVLLAVGASAAEVQEIAAQAGRELYLAMDNCPHQAVLVGDGDAIARAREIATGLGLMSEQLPYDRAVHTPLFAPFAEDLREVFARLPVRAGAGGLWSCTTAAPYPDDPEQIRELLVEHWTSPVRFRETVETLHADGARVFIEVGPRGNMTSFIEDILRGKPFCAVAANVRRRTGVSQLNHLTAMLAVHDVDLDAGFLFEQRAVAAIDWRAAANEAERAPTVRIPLSTSWPMLLLDDETAGRLRPARPSAVAPPSTAVASSTAAPPSTAVASSNGHGQAPVHPQVAAVAQPPAAPPVAPVTALAEPGDELSAAIEGHLQTMERFLQTGSDVIQAYLSGAAPVAVEQARLPLLGSVVNWQPESDLAARRVIDLAEDRYLLHHTLGRAVSRTDPELSGLAVMPLAMSIEILAEAASCLLPGRVVTGMRDVRAHRWLTVSEQPTTVEVSARRLAGDGSGERVAVQLHVLGEQDETSPVAEATVLLGSDFPPAPARSGLPLNDARLARWQPHQLYDEVMFHQPLWQGVHAIDAVAAGGAVARLRVLPRLGLLRGTAEPDFVLDPVVLDAAGQVVGFWAADCLERGRVVFPFRLAALDLYAPPPSEGELLDCTAAIALDGEHLVSSDIEVISGDGRCLMRLAGWEDKRFDVPDRFSPLTLPGELTVLSHAWERPVAAYSDDRIACRRLDSRLGADAGLWKQVWAARVLSRRERALLDTLSTPESRQLEWLGARTAAKEAVAALARAACGIDLLPADVEILPDEHGVPIVSAPQLEDLGLGALVSLTHSGGEAVALAYLASPAAGARIGIDVERLRARPGGFAHAAFTEHERQLLQALPAGAIDEWLVRCWCAREAAGKAAGRGLLPGPGAASVAAVALDSGRVSVDVEGRRMLVHTNREQDLIVATTVELQGGGSNDRARSGCA